MTPIRVLHLATTLRGGAGIAARRTHEALLEIGVKSSLICLTNNESSGNSIAISPRPLHVKLLSKINTFLQSRFFQISDRLVTPVSMYGLSDFDFNQQDFDVLHVHSFYNMLSVKSLREIAEKIPNKKIFVTMHDQRIQTGGCHYSGECRNYEKDCSDCPQVHNFGKSFVKNSYQDSMKALKNFKNLTLIAPSNWLVNKAKLSNITSDINTIMIRNPIPSCFFETTGQKNSKSKKIYFVSANLNNSLKGINVFIEAINCLQKDQVKKDFEVVFVGNGNIKGLDPGIKARVVSAVNDLQMASLLSEAHILVVPSIEDNLPSTMLEALAANCTVIGSRVGGISEVLDAAKMPTFKVGDVAELVKCLTNSLLDENRPERSVIQEFAYENVARNLLRAYLTT